MVLAASEDPSENFFFLLVGVAQSTWVQYLPSDQLPATAEHRFQALFTVQPMWALGDLEPNVIDLQGPGQSVETLLMRFTRKVQEGADKPELYCAR
ncbi:unnamed protein product [Closterium sp. Naga37s-1]|nr:unnamed protein product [Closterium sp. Naga37s-1]